MSDTLKARPFDSWLEVSKTLQHLKYGTKPEELEEKAYAEYMRLNFTAAIVEFGEFMQTRKWKPYKLEERSDTERDDAIEEIVDVLHHIANILVLERVTDEELSDAYMKKVQKNMARMDHHEHGGFE